MKFAEYLETNQPIIWKTFAHAKRENRLSHAYLLAGEAGTPLKEIAVFLAKSILCDYPEPLACEACKTCRRIENRSYADFVFLDGANSSVKKEDVQNVIDGFTKTPIEAKGVKIYIIHLIENMTEIAINSILKFLEEPKKNTYAILTTENVAKVLPTIISRCESMRVLLSSRETMVSGSLAAGVPLQDAEILSFFEGSIAAIQERSTDEDYIDLKDAMYRYLLSLSKDPRDSIFCMESEIIPLLDRDKERTRFFVDLLAYFFKDMLSAKVGQEIKLTSYRAVIEPLADKLPHLEESLLEIMNSRGQIDRNLNGALVLDHIAYTIAKEN